MQIEWLRRMSPPLKLRDVPSLFCGRSLKDCRAPWEARPQRAESAHFLGEQRGLMYNKSCDSRLFAKLQDYVSRTHRLRLCGEFIMSSAYYFTFD